jgi:hypothetical protein
VRCPLAKALIQCTTSPGELVICGLAPPPAGASLPRADARVLALLQRDSLRSPPPHRPHVSISEVLPSALASCGILSDTPYGWHLLTSYESACRLTPFPIAIARIRRAVFSTGLLWQCRPVSAYGCRRPILGFAQDTCLCRIGHKHVRTKPLADSLVKSLSLRTSSPLTTSLSPAHAIQITMTPL